MVLRTRITAAMLEPTFRSIHKHKLYPHMYHTEFKIVINETDNVDYFKFFYRKTGIHLFKEQVSTSKKNRAICNKNTQ